jgi:predicted deacetylase
MTARQLIRLDDACPTMDHSRWARLEGILDTLGIRPLVAVVPDNQDPVLRVSDPDPNFWARVRSWQAKGWTIALHGYQHQFHFIDRRKLLLPFYDRSEFAGLSFKDQSQKIRAAWNIFKREGIEPRVWIAPGHCFDRTTLNALKAETSIRIVSDGVACDQFHDGDFYWLPQQRWSLSQKPFGLWTICLHPNSMSDLQIDDLGKTLAAHSANIVSVSDLALIPRKLGLVDKLYSLWFWRRGGFYKWAGAIRRMLPPRLRRYEAKN